MKVKATGEFKRIGVNPGELSFIPEAGFEFEVTEERFNVLKGNNAYNAKFVEPVETIIETAKKEPEVETAVKKTRKTTKKSK